MRNLTIGTSVRPGRLAVLVDTDDASWQKSCISVIEYFTRMWGGCGNIIVPTDGNKVLPIFWNLLERFDPDYILYHRKTGQNLEIETPEKFEEAYRAHLSAWKRDVGTEANENQAREIREKMRKSIASRFSISPELQREMKERLAPFYFEEWVVEPGALTAGSPPGYPQTDVVDILPEIDHAARVVRISGDRNLISPLWWASAIGRADAEFEQLLSGIGVQSMEAGASREQACTLVSLAMTRHQRRPSAGYLHAEMPATLPEILESLPDQFSMIGLGSYRDSLASIDDWRVPVVAIAGNDLLDFALYHCLSRMRMRVVWLPSSVTEQALSATAPPREYDEKSAFTYALGNLALGDSQRERGLSLISASLGSEELGKIQGHFLRMQSLQNVPISIDRAETQIPASPIRHYEADNIDRIKSISLPDDGKIRLFETPLPRNFRHVEPRSHRWLTELRFDQHHLPRHYGLGEATMGASFFTSKEIRVSSVGPTYFCPSVMIFAGATAERSVTRPDIAVLEPLKVFQVIASRANLECSISDKGVYGKNASDKFGGINQIAEFLRSEQGQTFSAAYRDRRKPRPGEYSNGCMLAGRRYHDLRSLAGALNDPKAAADLLDRLSLLGILHRGYALKCGVCRHADWHPFRDLTDSFVCRRCQSEQIFTKNNWLNPDQPQVYYQLDELTYLGFEHDMHVPLLALDCLRRTARRSFLFVHELAYHAIDSDVRSTEIDINCIVDGSLVVGEAKREDHLGGSEKEEAEIISRYGELAGKLCARRIVFATAKEKWRETTLDRVHRMIDSNRFQITFLTRQNLYS